MVFLGSGSCQDRKRRMACMPQIKIVEIWEALNTILSTLFYVFRLNLKASSRLTSRLLTVEFPDSTGKNDPIGPVDGSNPASRSIFSSTSRIPHLKISQIPRPEKLLGPSLCISMVRRMHFFCETRDNIF